MFRNHKQRVKSHAPRPRVLFIGGTINQAKMMHKISLHLQDLDCRFTPCYYTSWGARMLDRLFGILRVARNTVLSQRIQESVISYLAKNDLSLDFMAQQGPYDLVVLGNDTFIPENVRNSKKILVQEGIIWPEGWRYRLGVRIPALLWITNSNGAGHSRSYDYFCVASQGYYEWFVSNGLDSKKLVVTGIPNFDNIHAESLNKTFEHENYVLVATHCLREDFEYENRAQLLLKTRALAEGKDIIVKLHPREDFQRSTREIHRILPEAIVYSDGDTDAMIAHCDVFMTTFSSTVFNALALNKPIGHCDRDMQTLMRLLPEQNARAAENIAGICRMALGSSTVASNTSGNSIVSEPHNPPCGQNG